MPRLTPALPARHVCLALACFALGAAPAWAVSGPAAPVSSTDGPAWSAGTLALLPIVSDTGAPLPDAAENAWLADALARTGHPRLAPGDAVADIARSLSADGSRCPAIETRCVANIAVLVGAESVIAPARVQIDGAPAVLLHTVDANTQRSVRVVQAPLPAEPAAARDVLQRLLFRAMLGKEPDGTVQFVPEEPDTQIEVDGRLLPAGTTVVSVTPGAHTVVWRKGGRTRSARIEIRPATETRLPLPLPAPIAPAPPPRGPRWTGWQTAGATVAGVGTLAAGALGGTYLYLYSTNSPQTDVQQVAMIGWGAAAGLGVAAVGGGLMLVQPTE